MGRKNKIKMNKSPGSSQSPEKAPLEEVKESLREIVGSVPAEASQKLQFLFSELEKKSLELNVAKECIKQLQQEKPFNDFRGDGDSAEVIDQALQKSIHRNQEIILQLSEVHVPFNNELKSIGQKVENLSEDRTALENQLTAAHEEIDALKNEVKLLESNVENTNISLENSLKATEELKERLKKIIDTLEIDLEAAKSKVNSMQEDIDNRESAMLAVDSDLKLEKELRARSERELVEQQTRAEAAMKEILQEASSIQSQIINLAFSIDSESENKKLSQFKHVNEYEIHLLEHGGSRLNIASNCVQDVKNEFDSVKHAFKQLREEYEQLEQKSEESETSLKFYQKNCEEYCEMIKELEEQSIKIKQAKESVIEESCQEFERIRQDLENQLRMQNLTIDQLNKDSESLNSTLDSIKLELEQECTENEHDILDAVRKLKDQHQNRSGSEPFSAAEPINVQSNSSDVQAYEQELQKMKEEKAILADKLVKLEEELNLSRSSLKKARKEKDSSTKRMKKRLDEVNAEKSSIEEQKKELEEKLSEASNNSISDESLRSLSEQSDSYRSQFEEMQNELSRLKEEISNKEQMVLDLYQTNASLQSQINSQSEQSAETSKLIQRTESRIAVLQRSAESMQKRFEEDNAATLRQLDFSESELEAQQDLNARLTTTVEEMRNNHSVEVARLKNDVDVLQGNILELTQKMSEMTNNRDELFEAREKEIELAKSTMQKAVEELESCKLLLAEAVKRSTHFENELARVEALEKKKTEVLVSLTEEEKSSIREEKETALIQLEAAQQALKEAKAEAKKQIDTDIRKLKKAIKTVEEQKNQALEEVSQVTLKLEESQQTQHNAKMYMEEEEKKHQKMLEEFEELQKSIQSFRAEHEKKLADEKALSDSLRTQVMQQDVNIAQMAANLRLGEQAIEELAQAMENKDKEHAAALSVERKQLQTLQKALEDNLEQVEASVNQQMLLEENERKTDQLRKEYETALQEISTRLSEKDNELEKKKLEMVECSIIDSKLKELENVILEKDAVIATISEKHSEIEAVKSKLEAEIDDINKLLADSPKKVVQLENRLGVIQLAAQAQNKRLEEDLVRSNQALENAAKNNAELRELIDTNIYQIDQLSAENLLLRSELALAKEADGSADQLRSEVEALREQNRTIDVENKKERAGLVDELIATKERMEEYEKLAKKQQTDLSHMFVLEQQLKDANETNRLLSSNTPTSVQTFDKVDEMFPAMDPAVRQLLRLISNNRNFAYGMIGVCAYAALLHLYILL